MTKYLYVFAFLVCSLSMVAQTTQTTIGSSTTDEEFQDIKFDPADGSTVKVGRVDNAGTGNDCIIVKSDINNQIVWQKVISNPGDDILYKVIVCANGDYVAIGQLYLAGIRRAYVCRINSTNGNIIWSSASNNSSLGELFWDGIETANHNIALVGVDSYQIGQSNSFIVLLTAGGSLVWSRVSTRPAADEFRTINQLSNGNFIVGGFYDTGSGNYNAVIQEIDSASAAINSENSYSINLSIPGGAGNVNSIWESRCRVKNNTILFELWLFQGFGTVSNQAICTYDQTTKNLSGNIFYHTGDNSATSYSFNPLTENDYLIGQSFSPTDVYVSRITGNTIVFDRKINNSTTYLSGSDLINNTVTFAGKYTTSNADGYNLITTSGIPASTSCNISDANTLVLQPVLMAPTAGSIIGLSPVFSMVNYLQPIQIATFMSATICLDALPVALKDFKATYNSANTSTLLQWTTTSEFNSKNFEIERSVNTGRSFEIIGSQKASGTVSATTHYEYTDENPRMGVNYYRLKQIDIDGVSKYSSTVSIMSTNTNADILIIYPNPAHDFAFVNLANTGITQLTVTLVNSDGRTVKNQKVNTAYDRNIQLNLNNLPTGIYFVKVYAATGYLITKKIILQ